MYKTIAIVINTSWNIFNFRVGLINALKEEGYRVVAIAPTDDYSPKLEELGIEHYDIKINNKGTNPFEDAKLVLAFFKLYKKIAPDVILPYTIKPNIYGSIAAGMLGIPVISNISGLGTVFLNDSFSSKIARLLYKVALQTPKKVFFQNIHDKVLFVDSKLVKESKTGLLPGSGIDTEKFKPVLVHKESHTPLRFLFIARLVKDKGLIEYIEAAKIIQHSISTGESTLGYNIQHYKKPKFFILGSYYPGNPTAVSKDQIQKWEKEGIISYIGVSDDVTSIISEYDCIVLPSYREGLSRVLLEAASMGKPIIATNVPGCKEVVDDGINGYLCEVRNAKDLAVQMKKIIDLNDEERKKMGEKGREKIVTEFDERLVIEKYKEAISELFGNDKL